MIEPPAPIRSNPAPTDQVRSKPVNGSVPDALAGCVLVAGALLAVAGAVEEDGLVDVGVFDDFDGEVPLFGVVAGLFGSLPGP
jgi:hypothetical protein